MGIYTKAFGWTGVSRVEMVDAMLHTFDSREAAKELGMYTWQWDIQTKRVNFTSESGKKIIASHLHYQIDNQTGPVYSALNILIKGMIPKSQELRFAKALNYAETDDKISGIIGTQVDFGMSGFRVAAKDAKAEKKIKEWTRSQRIYNLLLEMWNVAAAADNVVIMRQKKTLTVLPLPNLKIIPTHQTDSKGRKQFRTFLKIPKEMVDFIKKSLMAKGEEATKSGGALAGIPKKWIEAARHPIARPANDPIYPTGGYVELGEKGSGETIYIINRKGIEDRLIEPSMITVFPSIALRQLLQDGEFSIAYLIKYFIHQIKVGPKGEGKTLQQMLRAGTVSVTQREEVKARYRTKVDKAFFEVTDQQLEHIFHFPGADVDMGPRYATPDERINWWARISKQIVTGDKGSYSGGLIYLKGYSRKISRFRNLFSQFIEDVIMDVLEDKDAETQWDEHFMKEPRQKLKEIELMVKHGMDMETITRILGYSWSQWVSDREKTLPPEILAMKNKPDEAYQYWQALQVPDFEPNSGMLLDEGGGRPATTDEQTDDSGAADQPRPEGATGAEGVD